MKIRFIAFGLLVVLMMSLTVYVASAVTYESIGGTASDSEFRRVTDSRAVTWGSNPSVVMVVNGFDGSVGNVTGYPINAKTFVKECVQDYLDPNICYWVGGSTLYTYDFRNLNASAITLTGNLSKPYMKLHSRTSNEWIFTYRDPYIEWLVSKDLVNDDTANYTLPLFKPSLSTKYLNGYKVAPQITTYDATRGWVFWDVYYATDLDTYYIDAYYDNATGTDSFGYSQVASRTGFCYLENGTFRDFDDSDFPSDLFASYESQSKVLVVKPSCRTFLEFDIEDIDNIFGWEYPTPFSRDGGFYDVAPTLHIPSGVRIGFMNDTSSYYQNELFLNGSAGYIDFFNQDSYLNDGIPIHPYLLDGDGAYYVGFGDNAFTTIALSSSTLIYPTGLYDYTIATNLSTLDVQGLNLEVQDFIQTGSGNIDLQYGGDFITYVLTNTGGNSVISKIDAHPNNDLNLLSTHNAFSGFGVSLDGEGFFSQFSTDYFNLVLGTPSKVVQMIDYNLYPILTYLNYSSTNVIRAYSLGNIGGGVGIESDILTLRDSGTQVILELGVDTDPYPVTTYIATKSSKFAPLDLTYAGTSGSREYYFATAISPSGSGVGLCSIDDRTGISPIILCDTAPRQTTTTYPFSTSINGISNVGLRVTSYYNSTAVVNNILDTLSYSGTLSFESLCNLPSGVGTLRSVLRVNNTHALMGTNIGRIGICNVGSGEVTISEMGTISAENESILRFEPVQDGCFGNYCDETTDNVHFITDKYYATALFSTGASTPNFCGDLSCVGGESAFSCPVDCGAVCGDSYCTHNETAFSCPVDCGGAVCGNGICEATENETSCPVDCEGEIFWFPDPIDPPYIPPETTIDLRTMKVLGDNVLLGGIFDSSDEIRKLDVSDTGAVLLLTSAGLLDFPYSVDSFGDVVFVGTDDEINVFSGYNTDNLVVTNTDGWGELFHSDRVEDVVSINETAGFVCDNNDEFDFYLVGSDPVNNIGGGCFDLEFDSVGEVVFVDRDDLGVSSYDVTNPLSPTLLDTFNNRLGSHSFVSGDLMDLKDDYLLVKRNLYSMSLLDVSDPSNITLVADCNTAGQGEVISVEIYNANLSLGGTDDGRFVVCDTTNDNETTNTDVFTLDNFSGEEVRSVEMNDNLTAWLMGETLIQPYLLNVTLVQNNTAPNITSFVVSNNNPDINESIGVTVVAGNVEPVDVIRYGIKCEGTETEFTWNTNGIFTCSYEVAGNYNLRVAVTDNFHIGSWFDERVEPILVNEEAFTGGTLRVEVLDEEQNAIEGANVTLVATNETQTTGEYGNLIFSTPNDVDLYELITVADGYYLSVDNFYADGSVNIITLVPYATGTQSTLEVLVTDSNGNPLENALVSYTNTITYEYEWKWSNALGYAIFVGLDTGSVVVQASKDDFEASSTTAVIGSNQTTQVTLELGGVSDSQTRFDRDCVDNGIWLCGDVTNACTNDSDCLSDNCNVALGQCSRFNMSVCDEAGLPRGQGCIAKYSFESGMSSFTNWLLSNFLWVLIIVIVIVAMGVLAFAWRK